MPYKFSPKSEERLLQCHPLLQRLFSEVIKHYDCTILCGARSKEEQEEAFRAGLSSLQYPNSKHNRNPSLAIDVVPYPVDWVDKKRFYHFAGFVLGMAKVMGISLRWGGDWDGDFDLNDQKFMDLPHFELIEEKLNDNA